MPKRAAYWRCNPGIPSHGFQSVGLRHGPGEHPGELLQVAIILQDPALETLLLQGSVSQALNKGVLELPAPEGFGDPEELV